jgi:transposase-like protein
MTMTHCQDNSNISPVFRPEDRIRIVLKGLSGQLPVGELCRREQVPTRLYYAWCLTFMEAGKRGLVDGAALYREATQSPSLASCESLAAGVAV